MANLIPERRVDKNGVLTTKHVRAVPKTTGSLNAPPPSAGTKVVTPVKTIQQQWDVAYRDWGCSDELRVLCMNQYSVLDAYKCSDADAYDVLTVVAPENALPLLAVGIRSAEEAKQFLDFHGLSRLVQDNGGMVSIAIERGYRALPFLRFASDNGGSSHYSTFMDAADVHMNYELRAIDSRMKSDRKLGIVDMVLGGVIRMADLKEIGVDLVADRSMYDDSIFVHLQLLKDGRTAFTTASEMRQVILSSNENGFTLGAALTIGSVYGPELPEVAMQRDTREMVMPMTRLLKEGGRTPPENVAILEYALSLSEVPSYDVPVKLFEAGVSVEDADRGIANGLTVEQTIALAQKTVSSSLATGVL